MKLRHLGAFSACVLCLGISSAASAAFYDFNQWVLDNGEQGFDNADPFKLTVDGLQLTARAFRRPSNTDTHLYLDDLFNGQFPNGGVAGAMGVCPELDSSNQCTGNPSVERADREKLRWDFSEMISSITLQFVNTTNGFENQTFEYKYDGDPWTEATTDASANITLAFDGSSSRIQFRAKGSATGRQFYIETADVSAVPIPAAAWLFATGLLGLAGVARRSK